MTYPKRLIEVDLPIKKISVHARREKSIRYSQVSNWHICWVSIKILENSAPYKGVAIRNV